MLSDAPKANPINGINDNEARIIRLLIKIRFLLASSLTFRLPISIEAFLEKDMR